MNHTGSSDSYLSLGAEEEARHIRILRARLAHWSDPKSLWERFDNAVKALVEATLAERGLARPGQDGAP